ncbi:NAD-dependent epimerase/dehydratase family protein [Halapricum hydrolyticum]|uniref:NAD-dependent epimerase/dehydratase family protein n=1 Tax=Halapricum hydrolyticum TaxID=2979991 RepID=A0AAE3LFE2_9EURY|nr:NAD-dependent epimerase/dehydratase family protein [Halapricum hydrolyticum]MCU4718560.1 NAD-dependent epimerase/dehydratase family protein [Halapricum hydrolyticum]MCU4727591.1 NAD-dependent epimerase/dehydratase family protein [Halapricum hydrolyticum]
MPTVLCIGGTRFIGRATVTEFREHGYDVTLCNRGRHPNPFADDPAVEHVRCDRRDDERLRAVADRLDPDVVIDLVAYHPRDVRVATDAFADVDAYVFVSSGAAYGEHRIPKREDETQLEPCSEREAGDDSPETYGNRKAEGDRAVFAAAEAGVRAMSVRPTIVYGPHDYTERLDYWLARIDNHDRVVVPGDGTSLHQLAYVDDVASALRIVAEKGEAGEAYNVGDRHAPAMAELLELLAAACDADVETVYAGARELAPDLRPGDFPLYNDRPHLLSAEKLHDLGWEWTPHSEALDATVAEHRESDRDGSDRGPRRDVEIDVLDRL